MSPLLFIIGFSIVSWKLYCIKRSSDLSNFISAQIVFTCFNDAAFDISASAGFGDSCTHTELHWHDSVRHASLQHGYDAYRPVFSERGFGGDDVTMQMTSSGFDSPERGYWSSFVLTLASNMIHDGWMRFRSHEMRSLVVILKCLPG